MIIITGASRGIGKYLFDSFTNEGVETIGTYLNTSKGLNLDNYFKVDVTDYSCVENMLLTVKKELKNIVLLNCSGISYNSFAHKSELDNWNRVIDTNIKGTFNFIRAILPLMREQQYGRIVNFSSVLSTYPTHGVSSYSTSKAAVNGLTKSLAIENAAKGITVNAIKLGYVELGMGINEVPEDYRKELLNRIPAKRFCKPEEILNSVKYIIATEYLNGSLIDLNGGLI